ncbi:MAG: hypothetical protein LUD68_09425, partial [Rikenellaceae bacterium]|nr:hypothetical protein [Rikenellaceae bacterium]
IKRIEKNDELYGCISSWPVGIFAMGPMVPDSGAGLVAGDLKFGIQAARTRKEKIKRSRAVRRTVDKIGSYVLWILMGYTFGEAFGKPFGIDILPCVVLLIVYGVELESIFVNYFETKGKKARVNVLKAFARKTDLIDIRIESEPNRNPDAGI